MPKYEAWLTTYASVKTYLEIDEEYDLNNEDAIKELREKFVEDGESQASGLCHQCSRTVELADDFAGDQEDFAITLAEDE